MHLRELEEHVDFALVSSSLCEAVHHVHHPRRALAARCALSAGLVFVELGNRNADESSDNTTYVMGKDLRGRNEQSLSRCRCSCS